MSGGLTAAVASVPRTGSFEMGLVRNPSKIQRAPIQLRR